MYLPRLSAAVSERARTYSVYYGDRRGSCGITPQSSNSSGGGDGGPPPGLVDCKCGNQIIQCLPGQGCNCSLGTPAMPGDYAYCEGSSHPQVQGPGGLHF
jgi:hypothetical protein